MGIVGKPGIFEQPVGATRVSPGHRDALGRVVTPSLLRPPQEVYDDPGSSMRERSHNLGRDYQTAVKEWLAHTTFLGFKLLPFGDAYDATKNACQLGNVGFDFSLKLMRHDSAHRILYAECKYRHESRGASGSGFDEFLQHVSEAITSASDNDTKDNAVFAFISTLPPTRLRHFLRDRRKYSRQILSGTGRVSQDVISALETNVHVLILSRAVVERMG
jgi:hypothetical protein